MDDNKEKDFSDIVQPSANIEWQKYKQKLDEQASENSFKIFAVLQEMMGFQQCACIHTYSNHGEPPGPLSARSLQLAAKALKGDYIVRKCQACSCQEFETDNLEWLMKRKKWNSQSK